MGSASHLPPDTLLGGKIRLIKRIGRGGMGDVWIARNEATHAEVAVKTLQRSERTDGHDERFRREARLAATISHRHVVRIFDLVDGTDGTLGLVMELLRGGTLEKCMRDRGPLTAMQAIAVAVPILSALNHVHQKGIVHRDVKPANIFFAVEPDGHVIPKILDFGIAKLPAAGSALTVDGSVLGTPHYMSPEQIRGIQEIDGRSDMFSLAVVLYEMLTGDRVFHRDQASASLAAVLEHEVDPDPRIEPRVWLALSRALAKRPYERYATCAELADALRAAVGATDDQLAAALQELRPTNVVTSDSRTPQPKSDLPSSAFDVPKDGPGKRRLLLPLAFAGVTAVIAVIGTLAVVRGSSGPEKHVATPASPTGLASATAVPSSREVPPPPPADAVVTRTPPAEPTAPPRSSPRPAARPGTTKSAPKAGSTTSKTPKPLATTLD